MGAVGLDQVEQLLGMALLDQGQFHSISHLPPKHRAILKAQVMTRQSFFRGAAKQSKTLVFRSVRL
jgi:hypothetical protein